MDLRLLGYFAAVADELSFGRAAGRLFVTTPTVSTGVRELERSLGVRLFHRSSRSVSLTAEGRELLPHARRVLADADGVRAAARTIRGRPRLVVGTFFGLGAGLLEGAARTLRATGPAVDLQLRVYGWSGPARPLHAGEVDAAVLVGPTALDDRLVRAPLVRERRLALLPRTHPLAARSALTLPELDALRWVRLPCEDDVWHRWWRMDDGRGGPPPEGGPVHEDPHEVLLAVRNGEGTAAALESLRDQFSFAGLRLVPVSGVPGACVDIAVRTGPGGAHLGPFVEAVRAVASTPAVPAPRGTPAGGGASRVRP